MNHFTWSKRSSTPRELVVRLDLVVRPLIEEAHTRRSLDPQITTRSAHPRLILYHFDPTDHAVTMTASAGRQLFAVGREDRKQVGDHDNTIYLVWDSEIGLQKSSILDPEDGRLCGRRLPQLEGYRSDAHPAAQIIPHKDVLPYVTYVCLMSMKTGGQGHWIIDLPSPLVGSWIDFP